MVSLADTIGYVAASFTTLSFVPQVVRVMRTRETHSISKLAYLAFCFGVALWFAYGVVLASPPIMAANGATFVLACIVLAYKLRFG
jgi:MtN3 and saliva related transmembrane protein